MRALAVRWNGGRGGVPSSSTPTSSGLGGRDATALPTATLSALGAASKVVACVATYPTQVIRARLQQRQVGTAVAAGAAAMMGGLRYDGGWAAARTVLAREGVGGLYKGLAPTLLRVVPQSAVTFVVYERVLSLLSGGGQEAAAAGGTRG